MDYAKTQAKIYAGYAQVARRVGLDCKLLRPNQAANPFANQVNTIKAAFNSGDGSYKAANLPGDAIWCGHFDGRLTLPGDYLVRVSDGQIYYIAAQQPLLPIICIDCNRSIRITRPAPQASPVGAVGYSGLCDSAAQSVDILGINPANNNGIFVGWPCSILFGGKSQAAVGLPGDVKNTGWRMLLPPSVTTVIRAGDIAIDDLGRRYAIEGAEQSDTGWRINAQEAHV